MQNRWIRLGVFAALGLVLAAVIAAVQIRSEQQIRSDSSGTLNVAGVQIGGDFSLIDHDGNPVTHEDYADGYKLIYFGFTYCPAICPTELQKMTEALDMLDDDIASLIHPLFITVDPERDTVDVMRPYVALFHPDLVGLTGSQEQIDEVVKNYRVYATRVDDPDFSDYMVDHSSYTYLMSPEDDLLAIYRIQDTMQDMAADITKKIIRHRDAL